MPEPKTRRQLIAEAAQRFVVLQDSVTYLGSNGVARSLLNTGAWLASMSHQFYSATLRRWSLLGAQGEAVAEGGALDTVLEEHGAPRPGANRSRVFSVFRPHVRVVTAITSGATDLIEVSTAVAPIEAGDSIRIRKSSAVTEVKTVIAVTTGTGPNGGDEIEVSTLVNSYNPVTEEVQVLLRQTLPTNTALTSVSGVQFHLLDPVGVGDANAVLSGEGNALALLDKGWAECVEKGPRGQIDAYTLTGFASATPKVLAVFNPERAIGGDAAADDASARYRAAYFPALQNVETQASILALLQAGNSDVLRTIKTTPSSFRTVSVRVLHRNVGPLSSGEKASLKLYADQRMRAGTAVELLDVTLTSVEIAATVSLDTDATLQAVWRAAASRIATLLDTRTWPWGQTVERADLITIINTTSGVASLNSTTFTPAADVTVGAESLPLFVSLTLTDANTGDVVGNDITISY